MTNIVYCQLVSIHIISINPVLPQSTAYNLRAIGVFADNHTENLTGSCSWTSNNSIVQAYSAGQAYPFGSGTAFGGEIITGNIDGISVITANVGAISATTTVTVSSDIDGDGVLNVNDNCILTNNPTQVDSDADLIGDVCDCSISIPNPGNPYAKDIIIYAFPSNSINIGQIVTFYSTVTSTIFNTAGSTFNYQWTKNGLPVGLNSPEYSDNTLVNGDVINCIVTDEYYCILGGSQTSNSINILITALAVIENGFLDHTIVFYPNPTSQFLNLNSKSTIIFTEIVDVNGRIILSSSQSNNQVILNVENFISGIYLLKVTTKNGSSIQKIIINNKG
jgi:hypothetical protein